MGKHGSRAVCSRQTSVKLTERSQLAKYDYTVGSANGQCSCSAGSHITAVSEVIGSRTRNVAYGYDHVPADERSHRMNERGQLFTLDKLSILPQSSASWPDRFAWNSQALSIM
jgi:hypothetical protein